MAELSWKDLEIGNIVTDPGSATAYRTGDWRSDRPVLDKSKCIKCGLCWLYCPDIAWDPGEDGFFDLNEFYCKGCGVCVVECPSNAISMIEEEE